MKAIFDSGDSPLNEYSITITHFDFHSETELRFEKSQPMQGDLYYHEVVDKTSHENNDFSYPVIYPVNGTKFGKGILLLHGLNEKSWDKYLAWAKKLVDNLNRPVILFPIAYHMNRSPKSWSNPRLMSGIVNSRKATHTKSELTFANAALSTRLGANPEQFIYSGVQSYYDVLKLIQQIKKGDHLLFNAGTSIDFFAYSIGAFLAQILFLNNHDNLFETSQLFILAGGTTFDSMIGSSKYIMDVDAFKSLLSLRKKRTLKKAYQNLMSTNLNSIDQTWRGFYAMIYQRKGRKIRAEWLNERGQNIYAVILKKDKVMPASVIVKTLKGKKGNLKPHVDVIDFPFDYTHENPLPLKDEKNQSLVDRAFEVIFEKAVRFYQQPLLVAVKENSKELKFKVEVAVAK